MLTARATVFDRQFVDAPPEYINVDQYLSIPIGDNFTDLLTYTCSLMVFQDKVVLITGASEGIGSACAAAFRTAGAKLSLTALPSEGFSNSESVDEIRTRLGNSGGNSGRGTQTPILYTEISEVVPVLGPAEVVQ